MEIRQRTRKGVSVDSNGNKGRLKPLAPSTIKQREYLARKGKLSGETSPSTSNLTQSGSLVDNLRAKISTYSNGYRIEITVAPGDEKKARYVSEDRPFMHLTTQQTNMVLQQLTNAATKDAAKIIKSSIRKR